jgi:excisionase family DNA binding protein
MPDVLSAHQAAARRGVSERTVRRWIASGRLKADKVGGEFRIALEDLDSLTGHGAAAAADNGRGPDSAAAPPNGDSGLGAAPAAALSADLSSLVGLIERLQAQLIERTEAATLWQARAHMLEDRIRSLEAPRNAVASNLTAQTEDPTKETPEPPRRPDPVPALWPTPAPRPPDEDGHQPPEPNGHTAWWRRWWAWAVIAL